VLWGNVGVNTLLALLSGSVLGGLAAFLFSTIFITLFAEITPQAYFSRNALRVASALYPAVKFYQFLLYPVAKPTAKVLDWWLGPEGVHYIREEMLRKYIDKSAGAEGSDISRLEGRGAINFLALDSRRVGDEGSTVDPTSVLTLPAADGHLQIPPVDDSPENDFIQRVGASGKKWVVLADPGGKPHFLLNADRLLRSSLSGAHFDPHDYCIKPIITDNPKDTLEQLLARGDYTDTKPSERGLILYWGSEKRIVAHADVLHRLFEGVLTSSNAGQFA
jgi:hypothetical protein